MKSVICSMIIVAVLTTTGLATADSYWLTGGLIGAGVGGAAGVGVTYGACGIAEENKSSCRKVAMPAGGAVMAGAGFGIGALIGYAFKKDNTAVSLLVDIATETYGVSWGMSF